MEKNDVSSSELATNKKSESGKTFFITLCLSFVALLVSILTFVWFYYQNHQQSVQTSSKMIHLQESLQEQDTQITQGQQQAQQLRLRLQRLQQENQHAHTTWVLAEVEYLTKLALYNLMYENNTVLAEKLLETADQHLLSANNPGLQPVRQAIANNIMALNALPKIDTGGLIARINAISQQIEQIPLIPSQLPPHSQTLATPPNSAVATNFWHRLWNSFLQTLKEMLIIRRHQTAIEPLVTPEQKNFLTQNIQLKLSLAQWAILHQQPQVYQQALQDVYSWVSRYFLQNANATQNLLQEIKELQKINIKPTLPNLNDIFTAIESFSPSEEKTTPVVPQNPQPGQEAISS